MQKVNKNGAKARKILLVVWILFAAVATSFGADDNSLKLGDTMPNVSVYDHNGALVEIAQEGKTGFTLFFFYPRALTRGCTAQACSLRDAYDELQEKGVKIFGVSTDNIELQKQFVDTHNLPFQLLADTEAKVIGAFGVPLRNNTSAARQAFLFKDGKLAWLDASASTDKQAEDVLNALEKL